MRALIATLALALISSTSARAQDALTIKTPPGRPLVWDPEILVPEHEPASDSVLYRVLEVPGTEPDTPFFVDRIGIRVPNGEVDREAAVLSEGFRFAILVCSFTGPEPFDLVRPEIRSRYCAVWRSERQP